MGTGYLLVVPRWGASNEYPQHVSVEKLEKYGYFLVEKKAAVKSYVSWMHRPTGDQEVVGSTPAEVGNILSWSEIFSAVILSLLLIQEGQLSDSGKRMCTILVNSLVD